MRRLPRLVISLSLVAVLSFSIVYLWRDTEGKLTFEAKVAPETLEIVNRIASDGSVRGFAVGYALARPKQYDNFIELQAQATTEELVRKLMIWSQGWSTPL